MTQERKVVAVSALAVDGAGAVLCVRRAHAPAEGRWSLPGGRVEAGEGLAEAVAREVTEEIGLAASVGRVIGIITVPGSRAVYEVSSMPPGSAVACSAWGATRPTSAG